MPPIRNLMDPKSKVETLFTNTNQFGTFYCV